jgi:hypothetical protein
MRDESTLSAGPAACPGIELPQIRNTISANRKDRFFIFVSPVVRIAYWFASGDEPLSRLKRAQNVTGILYFIDIIAELSHRAPQPEPVSNPVADLSPAIAIPKCSKEFVFHP